MSLFLHYLRRNFVEMGTFLLFCAGLLALIAVPVAMIVGLVALLGGAGGVIGVVLCFLAVPVVGAALDAMEDRP